jgi:hypothetical protein
MDEEIESFQLGDKAAEVPSSAAHQAELAESSVDAPSDPDADPSVDSAERH